MSWQPKSEGVEQIVKLFAECLQPGVNQSQIFSKLQQCSAFPDFNNYLVHIFANEESISVEVRQSAGLLLKNNLKTAYVTTQPDFQAYIKSSLLRCIGSPSPVLRHTVGAAISVIAQEGGIQAWPEMCIAIGQCLYSEDFNHMEGALDALHEICEDIPAHLDFEVAGLAERPANAFVPRLLQLFTSPHPSLKRLSIACVNQLLTTMPSALYMNMDRYLQELYSLRNDENKAVRKLVCGGFVIVLGILPDRLHGHLREIIQYMLQSTQDSDPEVALESCEFWSAFCDSLLSEEYTKEFASQSFFEIMREFLPQLIPILLTNMNYAEDDEDVIAAEADEAERPDREEDLKPIFHKSQAAHGAEAEEDEDDDEVENVWNLRKCSAAGIDTLSSVYREELLPLIMPMVQARLQDPSDWKVRESAILCVGAIAEGCFRGLSPYLPQLVQMLSTLVDDPRPLVRSIACWTLSRFSRWICDAARGGEGNDPTIAAQGSAQLDHVLSVLLRRVLDGNKRVQEAACSAIATLEEEAGRAGQLASRIEPILQHLMMAFQRYQRKNLRILYDALGTLADGVGDSLNQPQYVQALVPPLLMKWQQLGDSDRDLFPLLACLNSIVSSLSSGMKEYSEPVFQRCIALVQQQLHHKAHGVGGTMGQTTAGEYDKEFIVCALDLLCVLVRYQGPTIEHLLAAGTIREMLLVLCADDAADIRQSAFELLGDMAKSYAVHLSASTREFFQLALQNLSTQVVASRVNLNACNNACWAIGELAVKVSADDMREHVTPLVAAIVPMLSDPRMNKSLLENSTITIGRIGLMCPEQVAPSLDHFMNDWCRALRNIRDEIEKEHAFLGLCRMLHVNPGAGFNSFAILCMAVASWYGMGSAGWYEMSAELKSELGKILRAYKDYIGQEKWPGVWNQVEEPVRNKLASIYGL